MSPTRLELHYSYLSNFDFLDKELQTLDFIMYIPKLKALNIQSKSSKYQLMRDVVTKSLILEVFGNQRFFVKKIEKTFSKSLLFELTLRKRNLFLFLENCLNTIFLYERKSLNLDNITIESKLYFYLNNDIINYFILAFNLFRYSIRFLEFSILSKKIGNWSFYLIPARQIRG